MPWDTTVISYMAKEKGIEVDEMNELLHGNLKRLIGKR